MIRAEFIRKISNLDLEIREAFLSLLDEVERIVGESVRRDDFLSFAKQTNENFNKVWAAINELAEAQRRTEERLNQLAEAQKKTEERLNQLTERVDQLAEAQRKTEERLDQLTERVDQLAEAQRRTELEIQKLTERMASFEKRMETFEERMDKFEKRMDKFEKRMETFEKRMDKFEKRMANFEERLEGVSNSVGYGLENTAYKYLPSVLKRDLGIEVEGRLRRLYMDVAGKRIQINIFGYGRKKDSGRVMIIGECKVRMSNRELNTFMKRVKKIEEQEGVKVFPLVVAHDFTPDMEERLKELGITYYWSFELE